jgi:GTP-binding protein
LDIEEPTVKMTFMVNDSPFTGQEGKYSTTRQIQKRLYKELETDMALKVKANTAGTWTVSGRGELHLAILIERMRREGYELQVSRPQVINKKKDGKTLTPYERVFIEVPEKYQGTVIQKLGGRKGKLKEIRTDEGITYLEFTIPTRGLFGYRSEFLTDTRGSGIINTSFYQYDIDPGKWQDKEQGSLVAHQTGTTCLYGLVNVQGRGQLFIEPGVKVYTGQVVGQNSRPGDIRVNVCKEKQLSNMRSKQDAAAEHFNKPKEMDLEDSLEFIGDDELVEVTPQNVRIRKVYLDEATAKRMAKK